MSRFRQMLLLCLLGAAALSASGCGNKGDLYLPDRAERAGEH